MESVSVHYRLLREELVPYSDSEWPHLWNAPNLPCLSENWDSILAVLVREYLEFLRDDCTQALLALLSVSRATARATLRLLVCHLACGRYQIADGLTQPNFLRLFPLCPLQFLDASVEHYNSWKLLSSKHQERVRLLLSRPLHCADQLHGLAAPSVSPGLCKPDTSSFGLDGLDSLPVNSKEESRKLADIPSTNTNTNTNNNTNACAGFAEQAESEGIGADAKLTVTSSSSTTIVSPSETNEKQQQQQQQHAMRHCLTVEPDSTLWRLLEETRLGKLEEFHAKQFANSTTASSHFKETFAYESFSHVAEQRRRRLSGVRQAKFIYEIMTGMNIPFARAYFFQYLLHEEFHPKIASWKAYETELNSDEFEVENWLLNEKMDNKTYMAENKLNDGAKSWTEFYCYLVASLRGFVRWIGNSQHLYRDIQDYAWKMIERCIEYYPNAFQLQPPPDETDNNNNKNTPETTETNFLARFLKLRIVGEPPISLNYWVGLFAHTFVASFAEENAVHLRSLAKRIKEYRENNQSILADIHGNLALSDGIDGKKARLDQRIEGREIVGDGLCYYFESVAPGLFELIVFLAVLRAGTAEENPKLGRFDRHMRQFELLALFCPLVFIRAICQVSQRVCDGLVTEPKCVLRLDLKLNSDSTTRYITLADIRFDERSQYERGIEAMSELEAKLGEANRLMAPFCHRLGLSIFLSENEIDRSDEMAWWNKSQPSDQERLEAEEKEKTERSKNEKEVAADDEIFALDEEAFEKIMKEKEITKVDVDDGQMGDMLQRAKENFAKSRTLLEKYKTKLRDHSLKIDSDAGTLPGVSLASALFAHELKNGIFAGLRPLASVLRDTRKDMEKQLAILKVELGRIEEFEKSLPSPLHAQNEKPVQPDLLNTNASISTSTSSATTANNTNDNAALLSQSASSKELLEDEDENEVKKTPGWLRGSMDLEYGAKAEQKYQYTDDSAYWINSDEEFDGEDNEDVDIS